MITAVKKTLTRSCFLACVESFLIDNSIEHKDQKYMAQKLMEINFCDGTGLVPFTLEKCACRALNIELTDIAYHFPIYSKYDDGALLIGTSKDMECHCVRYSHQEEEEKIIVMDPEDGKLKIYDKGWLQTRNPKYYYLKMIVGK